MLNVILNLFIVIAIFIVIAAILSGLRVAIHRFFNIYVEKKVFFIYLIFYTVVLVVIFALLFSSALDGGAFAISAILFLILIIGLVEYAAIYKRFFDYEPGRKYIFCILVSYFFNFMLLILISNIIIIVLALLFG